MCKRYGALFLIMLFHTSLLSAQNLQYGNNPNIGKYAPVNGIQLYYEIYGEGEPLLLLHGNGGSIAGRANIIPALIEKKFKVIAVDSRCHGKSGCGDQELSYEIMAKDVIQLLEQLRLDSLYIWGHSDGAIIGLIMAYSAPRKVKKLVATGANLSPDTTAIQPELVALMKQGYSMIPNGVMMKKHLKLMMDHPHITVENLRSITAPVLVMTGDRDAIRLEHTVKIFESIPNANLCILPATTHYISTERPEILLSWFDEFFNKSFKKPSTVEIAQRIIAEMMKNQQQR